MKKLLYFVILIVFFSCGKNSINYDTRLLLADSLRPFKADSSWKLIKSINIQELKREQDKAYYSLIYTKLLYWFNVHPKNDSLIKLAVNYYEQLNDSAKKSSSYLYAAKTYESLGNRKIAIDYFNKAIKYAKHDSYKTKMAIYIYWAFMMKLEKPYDVSMNLFNKSEYFAKLAKDTMGIVNVLTQKGGIYLDNNMYDSAIICYDSATVLSKYTKEPLLQFQPLNRLAECYIKKGDVDKSLRYAQEAQKYVSTSTHHRYINSTLARIYINLGQWNKAQECLLKSVDTLNIASCVLFYELMTNLYQKQGDYKRANKYSTLYLQSIDSLYNYKEQNNAIKFQNQYDYTQSQIENKELRIKSKNG